MELLSMPPFVIVPCYPRVFFHRKQPQPLSYEQYHRLLMFHQAKSYDQNVPRPIKSRWTFPGNRWKLNTDGSSKGNLGYYSFGGLIRNNGGGWVCGYMGRVNKKSCTSLEAEVSGMYYGLCLIRDKKLSNLFIETDCEEALMMIRGKVENDHPLKFVLDDIKTIMTQQRCGMFHTRRDGNQCADQLAKLGGSQFQKYVVLEKPPSLLLPYLARDINAAKEFEDLNKAHK